MTRIFDALKKVQAAREPALVESPAYHPPPVVPVHSPPSPLHVTPPRPVAPAPAPDERPRSRAAAWEGIETVEVRELPDELVRELTTLRIGIEAAVEDGPVRAILFMASMGGEGTSTVAAEFAAMLANDHGVRALLVEAHARRPSLAARFGVDGVGAPAKGEGAGRLSVMPVSPEVERRGMFAPATLRDLIGAASGTWDWVIIDGPPVLEAPEATELAILASGVVVVVEAGSTKRHVVTRAVDLLRKAGARVLGSVLNRRRLEIPDFIYRRI